MQKTLLVIFFFSAACSSDKGITKFNTPPDANIISHTDGSTLLEAYSVTFEGIVSDANHLTEDLVARWQVDGEVICDYAPVENGGLSRCQHVVKMSDSIVTLVVKDPEDATGDNSVSLVILPSETPEAEIILPSMNDRYYSDQLITFRGVLFDNEDEPDLLHAIWSSSRGDDLSIVDVEPDSDGIINGFALLSEGQHAIELHVTDSTGKTSGAESVIITVGPPNSEPTCSIVSPLTGAVEAQGSLVTFQGLAGDVDIPESMLQASWHSDKDGDLGVSTVNSSGEVSFPISNLSVNTHVIRLTVADEVGATCIDDIIFTVGTPPVIHIDTPQDGALFNEGEMISFRATVEDILHLPNQIALEWTLADGTLLNDTSATSSGLAQFAIDSLPAGSQIINVTATNPEGLTSSDVVSLTINDLPSAPSIFINPSPAYTDSVIIANGSGSVDAEGAVTYEYLWNFASTTVGGSTLLPSDTQKHQMWTVTVTPIDNMGQAGTSTTESLTIQNSKPIVDSVSILPAHPISTDTLSCVANVSDVDGDGLTIGYTWMLDGVVQAQTSDILHGPFSVGSEVRCIVTPNDGEEYGTSADSVVNIENSLPVVDAISLSPGTVYTNDTIVLTTSLSDPDQNQTITVQHDWYVVDFDTGIVSLVQSGSIDSLQGVQHFDKGDEVYVVTTPNDGIDDGSPVTSASLVIQNSAPEGLSISAGPNPAILGWDDLICTIDVVATDDDGDAVSYDYVWMADGIIQQSTATSTATMNTFSGADTWEGTWTCMVTPTDGTSFGASQTLSLTVESGCVALDFEGTSSLTTSDGSTQYVVVPDHSELSLYNTDFTMEAWIRPDTTSGGPYSYRSVVSRFDGVGSTEVGWNMILNDDGKIHFAATDLQSGNGFWSVGSVNFEQWNHIAVTSTANSETATIYINGQASGSGSIGIPPQIALELFIGRGYQLGSGGFNYQFAGQIHSLHISDTIRYAADFTPAVFVPDSSSIALLELGSEALDVSGNGHDGLIVDASVIHTCPDEDLDEDGYLSWNDCDENNSLVHSDCDCPDVLSFGVSSDGVSIPNLNSMPNDQTMEAWIKLDSAPTDNTLLMSSECGSVYITPTEIYAVTVNNCQGAAGNHCKVGYNNSTSWMNNNRPGAGDGGFLYSDWDGTWKHVAVTVDTNHVARLFIDGIDFGTAQMIQDGCISGLMNGWIGNGFNTWSITLDGDIAALRMSSSLVYAGSFTPQYPLTSTASTEALYVMENNENTAILTDESGNGHDATILSGSWVESTPNCEDLDGDGFTAWEDCDDSNPQVNSTCLQSSCLDILLLGQSNGDGMYQIDPDGAGLMDVYCDMTTDGGGWTLIANGGGQCASISCSTSTMPAVSTIGNNDSCRHLSYSQMSRIASNSQEVALRVGNVFDSWDSSAQSTNALAIDALLSPTGNWHNGATFDNWNWATPISSCAALCSTGWPNMYHACGDITGVHWIVGDGHDRYSTRLYGVTSTWLR